MPDGPKSATINPPQQARSRRTLERIVEASLEILAAEGPDALTVHRVVDKAGSSVGSFYARFEGKDDLLDYLSERVWTEALDRWTGALESRDWRGQGLAETVEGSVQLIIDSQRSRSAYLKALDQMSGHRRRAYEAFREQLLAGLGDLLLARRTEMTHPSPDVAVRFGLRAVLGIVDAEFRRIDDQLPAPTLLEECRALLMAYLTGDTGAASDEGAVQFFDVWS